jgi:twinkle protein
VVLAFDTDDAGNIAAAEVGKIFPEAMRAQLPAKDANEALIKGHKKALKNSVLFKAVKQTNSKLIYGDSLTEDAAKPPELGLSFPWPAMSSITRGQRFGEVMYIGGPVKSGKSEVLNAMAVHNILVHGEKVFMVKPEEANTMTYKLLVGKAASKKFHDPTVDFDTKAWEEWEPKLRRNVAMLNLYQHADWDTVKQDIMQAAGEGFRVVYIDPITNFTNTLSASEANEKLGLIASEAASLAKDLGLFIVIFCHLKAPTNGTSHERGGKVLSSQFAGSRSMMRSAHYMLGIQCNKDPELPIEERNKRDLVVLEDRQFGHTGIIPLYWDYKTGQFSERNE